MDFQVKLPPLAEQRHLDIAPLAPATPIMACQPPRQQLQINVPLRRPSILSKMVASNAVSHRGLLKMASIPNIQLVLQAMALLSLINSIKLALLISMTDYRVPRSAKIWRSRSVKPTYWHSGLILINAHRVKDLWVSCSIMKQYTQWMHAILARVHSKTTQFPSRRHRILKIFVSNSSSARIPRLWRLTMW